MEVVTYKQNAQIAIIKYTSEFFKPKSYKKYDGSELIGNNGIPPPKYDCHCSPLDGADKKYKRQNIR